MRQISTLLLMFVLLLSGLFIQQYNYKKEVSVAPSDHSEIGTIKFTGFRTSHLYKIESIPEVIVGERYSEIFNGPQGSVISDILPLGTPIYTVPGKVPSKELTIRWHGIFVKVMRVN